MESKFQSRESKHFPRAGQSVRAFCYHDYTVDPHNHDFYELNIVLGGTGTHRIEGATFAVGRGDVFLIPPMTTHAYSDTDRLEVYHVLFKRDFIKQNEREAATVPGFLQLVEIAPFLRKSCSDPMFLRLSPARLTELQQDLRLLEGAGARMDDRLLPLCHHTAWKLLYSLSYLLHEQTGKEKRGKASRYRREILDTLEYLNGHFGEKVRTDALAERVFLSRSTFLRSFRAVCGCTPAEYLKEYRKARAAELLATSSLSKTEIAQLSGFYDLSHMERTLRATKKE